MKKMMNMMLVLGVICCMCTGCGNGEDEPVALKQPYNVSLVTVIANNNPVLDTGIDELAHISEVAGTTYSCILSESTPNVICDGTVPDFRDRGYTADMVKRAQLSVSADIIGQLDAAEPDSDEVDIAAATSLAVRKLRSNQIEGRDNILVYYGSGVSTSGLIDMTNVPICDLDIETSATNLASTMNLDMTGIRVVWYCCGDIAGAEQNPLSNNEKKIMKDFYSTWLSDMGADEVIFKEDTPLDGAYSFDYQVSVMKTEGTQSGLSAKVVAFEDVEETEMEDVFEEVFAEGDILTFDDKSVSFLPDSTELVDTDVAMEALSYVISYMESHPEFKVMICGTTTSAGEPDSCISFSEKRAQAICSLLIEKAGIDESRIITLGCGWSSCLYVNDRADDGNLNENAPLNRSVKLVDYNSKIASEIIQSLKAQ